MLVVFFMGWAFAMVVLVACFNVCGRQDEEEERQ